MSKNVVIVESPAKAKTIEKFLGKEYKVISSQGHVRDIVNTKELKMGIDFSHGYAPVYAVESNKVRLVQALNREVSAADTVWLASDEDREGEAIAWHLSQVLDLSNKTTHRIVFHEITKDAILHAIKNPRDIDSNLVDAQQARRVLDRIVGFELSPVLWKKIASGLSAGRVQSVAVRLIVEREREIENFKYTPFYRITADFHSAAKGKSVIHAELNKNLASLDDVKSFLNHCTDTTYVIEDIQTKPLHSSPAPPFTTSTLQQESARKLKFSVSKTMRIAQSLYEAGHITYMRTDSVNLSNLALDAIKKLILQDKRYGEKYYTFRQYHTKTKGAQEAHEAIRPTYVDVEKAGQTQDEQRLYDLIRKRTIASQMTDAQFETTKATINCNHKDYFFTASGKVTVFEGFTKVYEQSYDEEKADEHRLPPIRIGENLTYERVKAQQSFTKPLPRYSEASLVKKMEDLGIGRPSTYASIISTIQERNYVSVGKSQGKERNIETLLLEDGKLTEKLEKEHYNSNTGRLCPTDLGKTTNDFLVEHFPNTMDYNFTAKEEEDFDRIADGEIAWSSVIDAFYKVFHPVIENIPLGKVETKRLLGKDPATKNNIYARLTKNGPCIQVGDVSDNEKPKYVSLLEGQSIFTVTLEEALDLLQNAHPLNRVMGQIAGEDVVTGVGRFGPYLRKGNVFVSVPKNLSIDTITLQEAIELFKKKEELNKILAEFGEIKIINGRYGPFIKTSEGNYKIPKDYDVEKLTEEQCKNIISNGHPTGSKRGTSYNNMK